jgi:hypothetical protein
MEMHMQWPMLSNHLVDGASARVFRRIALQLWWVLLLHQIKEQRSTTGKIGKTDVNSVKL